MQRKLKTAKYTATHCSENDSKVLNDRKGTLQHTAAL